MLNIPMLPMLSIDTRCTLCTLVCRDLGISPHAALVASLTILRRSGAVDYSARNLAWRELRGL